MKMFFSILSSALFALLLVAVPADAGGNGGDRPVVLIPNDAAAPPANDYDHIIVRHGVSLENKGLPLLGDFFNELYGLSPEEDELRNRLNAARTAGSLDGFLSTEPIDDATRRAQDVLRILQ